MLETEQGTLFESGAIARFIAKRGDNKSLLGSNEFESAQVDQWIDFSRGSFAPHVIPIYIATFGVAPSNADTYNEAVKALKEALKTLNTGLEGKEYLVGNTLTVADLINFTTLVIPFQVALDAGFQKAMPNVTAWFQRIAKIPEVVKRMGNIKMASKTIKPNFPPKEKPAAKPQPAKKPEGEEAPKKKETNPLDELPPSKFDLFNFKTFYVNHPDKKGAAVDEFLKIYDPEGYTIYFLHYEKYTGEGEVLHITVNLMNGFLQRMDHFRKHAFAMHAVLGEEPNLEIEGVWLFRGKGVPAEVLDHPQFEYYQRRELDISKPEDVQLIREFWGGKVGETANNMKIQECKFHK
jgi:elongation factor 1-gamma